MRSIGYIKTLDGDKFQLTTRGNEAKELGGHKKFLKYKKNERSFLNYQRWTTGGLIFATALAALSPVAIEWVKNKDTKADAHKTQPPYAQPYPTVDTFVLVPYSEYRKIKRATTQQLLEKGKKPQK